MNDKSYFIEKFSTYNYADDNSMWNASVKIKEVTLNLKYDSKITTANTIATAVNRLIVNGKKLYPEEFL